VGGLVQLLGGITLIASWMLFATSYFGIGAEIDPTVVT
jgi:hypothetical protein